MGSSGVDGDLGASTAGGAVKGEQEVAGGCIISDAELAPEASALLLVLTWPEEENEQRATG